MAPSQGIASSAVLFAENHPVVMTGWKGARSLAMPRF